MFNEVPNHHGAYVSLHTDYTLRISTVDGTIEEITQGGTHVTCFSFFMGTAAHEYEFLRYSMEVLAYIKTAEYFAEMHRKSEVRCLVQCRQRREFGKEWVSHTIEPSPVR